MAIDPVCNMTVDEKKAAATSDIKGRNITSAPRAAKSPLTKLRKNIWQRSNKFNGLNCTSGAKLFNSRQSL